MDTLNINTVINIVAAFGFMFSAGIFIQQFRELKREVRRLRKNYHWLAQRLTEMLLEQGIKIKQIEMDDDENENL